VSPHGCGLTTLWLIGKGWPLEFPGFHPWLQLDRPSGPHDILCATQSWTAIRRKASSIPPGRPGMLTTVSGHGFISTPFLSGEPLPLQTSDNISYVAKTTIYYFVTVQSILDSINAGRSSPFRWAPTASKRPSSTNRFWHH